MYKVMLAVESQTLLRRLMNLDVWEEISGYRIHSICRDVNTALEKAREISFDCILIEPEMEDGLGCELLARLREADLGQHILFCGMDRNFDYALCGIRNQVMDYLTDPFREEDFLSAFRRIDQMHALHNEHEEYRIVEIMKLFRERDKHLYEYLQEMFSRIELRHSCDGRLSETCSSLVKGFYETFSSENPWIGLYYQPACEIRNGEQGFQEISELFGLYTELYPAQTSADMENVLLFILNHPEDGLRLKDVARQAGVSDSALSISFSEAVHVCFSDYTTAVKMSRAACLLSTAGTAMQNADENSRQETLTARDVASRLGYKDAGYFSRIFRERYGLSPGAWRKKNGMRTL